MDIDAFIKEVEADVSRLKLLGRHTFFMMSQDITKSQADKITEYFSNLKYDVEVKMCPRKKWDIIIKF
jgi:hypothetical protein